MTSWVSMMAAMMLPGAAPAVWRRVRAGAPVRTVPLFVGAYLAVWALVSVAAYVVYRPHSTLAAGAIAIAAGLYEITPLKRYFRRRCSESGHSGFTFGFYCFGSCALLMLMQTALGVMSVAWMAAIAAIVLAQKLLPPKAVIDMPLALAIVVVGMLLIVTPLSVLGLIPPMCGS